MIGEITANGLLGAFFGKMPARRPLDLPTRPQQPSAPAAIQSDDTVEISGIARSLAAEAAHAGTPIETRRSAVDAATAPDKTEELSRSPTSATQTDPSAEEEQQVEKLERRDREVRRHEQAHQAAGGQWVRGGPTYEYETGPDGKRYATGGEVQIDTAPIPDDPQATIAKMRQVRRAALAPAEPSAQDRAIASKALQTESQARAELAEKKRAEREGEDPDSQSNSLEPTPQRMTIDLIA